MLSYLHEKLGFLNLVFLYGLTTLISACLFFAPAKAYRASTRTLKQIDKKWMKSRSRLSELSAEDIQKMRAFLGALIFTCTIGLVAIPGLVTDSVGIALAVPFARERLVQMQMANGLAAAQKPKQAWIILCNYC